MNQLFSNVKAAKGHGKNDGIWEGAVLEYVVHLTAGFGYERNVVEDGST